LLGNFSSSGEEPFGLELFFDAINVSPSLSSCPRRSAPRMPCE
jgi:hypothetical protein